MVKLVNTSLSGFLLFIIIDLAFWSDGVRIGPFIRELIKPAVNNRKQGVFLADFSPDYSVALNFPEKNSVAEVPKTEVEEGEFYVKAPNNYGLMVVVQYLSLRTQIRGVSIDRAYQICRDYIKLADNRGKESDEICGYVYFRDINIHPEKLIGPRAFYSANGEVNVKLFIDKSEGEDLSIALWNSVQLTFTAVSECKTNGAINPNGSETVRPCYPNQTINDHIPAANCISSTLFCDDHFQCGFEGLKEFGTDEIDCQIVTNFTKYPSIKQPLDEGGSNSVLMILLTFLGLILIIVFIGAYVSSEYNLSCSSFLPRSILQRGVSNTRISKSAEVDDTSVSNTTSNTTNGTGGPANYSSFTIQEPR